MDVECPALRHDVLIDIAGFLPFVVCLGVADCGIGQVDISDAGSVSAIVSCHDLDSPFVEIRPAGDGGRTSCGSVITHYDTFIPEGCKVPWALRGGLGRCPVVCGQLPGRAGLCKCHPAPRRNLCTPRSAGLVPGAATIATVATVF